MRRCPCNIHTQYQHKNDLSAFLMFSLSIKWLNHDHQSSQYLLTRPDLHLGHRHPGGEEHQGDGHQLQLHLRPAALHGDSQAEITR